jgi:hypothetical protein
MDSPPNSSFCNILYKIFWNGLPNRVNLDSINRLLSRLTLIMLVVCHTILDIQGEPMKKIVPILLIAFITAASLAQAGPHGLPFPPRILLPPPPPLVPVPVPIVPVPPPPVPAPPRVEIPLPPEVLFDVAPHFVAPSQLGFYVGVDTPYDIIFSSGYYYLYYENSWHRSRSHNGPWAGIAYRQLPPGIRKHRIEQIRSYRDREFNVYRDNQDRYRGRHFQPGHERRENLTVERRYENEQRREHLREERRQNNERREHVQEERRRNRDEMKNERPQRAEKQKEERRPSREEGKNERQRGKEEVKGDRRVREERKDERKPGKQERKEENRDKEPSRPARN